MKVPLDRNTTKLKCVETPSGDLSSHRVDRKKGNAKTCHHPLFDRLGMVELHRHSEPDPRSLECAFGDAPGRRPFLPHEQGLIGERLGRDVPALRPRVSRRNDKDELIDHASR